MIVRRLSKGIAIAALGLLMVGTAGCGGGTAGTGGGASPTPTEPQLAGKWVAKDPAKAFLQFDEPDADNKGRVTGADGCNGIQGDYTLKGNKATIKRGFGTLKACPGVNDWLRKVLAVEINGDTLVIKGEKDKQIGTLTRSE